MKEKYTNPTAEILLLCDFDVLTVSEDWIPGDNETERSERQGGYSAYPNY